MLRFSSCCGEIAFVASICILLAKVCYFTNSGSEANDVALKMARLYTKAHDIVSLRYVS